MPDFVPKIQPTNQNTIVILVGLVGWKERRKKNNRVLLVIKLLLSSIFTPTSPTLVLTLYFIKLI